MCGIIGVIKIDNKPIDSDLLVRMRDRMVHRGPDDAGIYVQGPVGLAHRRLSIIDLTLAGHQPMLSDDGTIALVFNGEIFNYFELRQELIRKGHHFRSTSDTEVIIHQYQEDGERCVEKFNGMFAFAVWDARKERLFAARDRLGIKPLYYYSDRRQFIVASEVKAIIEDPRVPRVPDPRAIADFFFAGRPLGNKTMFKNIRQVEPGFWLAFDQPSGQVSVHKYWDIQYNYNHDRSEAQVIEELSHLLDDAVMIHCRSDAPLGCHLSGGMDTSLVTAFAARHRRNLKTFSIKFSEDDYIDETRYAKAVARHVNADYNESTPTIREIEQALPFLAWHMENPIASMGGYNYYSVSEFAKGKVKVTLTGHGGDEVFAGYPAQFQTSYQHTDMFILHTDPESQVEQSLLTRIRNLILRRSSVQLYQAFKRRLQKQKFSFEDQWIMLHCGTLPQENNIFQKDFIGRLNGYSPRDDYIKTLYEAQTDELIDKCLYHDIRSYLPGLLHVEDRASMAVSIESRVPLLDYRIIEYLATVPPEIKVKNLEPKYLMRRVAASMLPEEVWQRKDKRPFPMPGRFLSSDGMQALAQKVLLAPDSLQRGIVHPKVLKEICSNSQATRSHEARQILSLELWFQMFVDNQPEWRQLAGV